MQIINAQLAAKGKARTETEGRSGRLQDTEDMLDLFKARSQPKKPETRVFVVGLQNQQEVKNPECFCRACRTAVSCLRLWLDGRRKLNKRHERRKKSESARRFCIFYVLITQICNLTEKTGFQRETRRETLLQQHMRELKTKDRRKSNFSQMNTRTAQQTQNICRKLILPDVFCFHRVWRNYFSSLIYAFNMKLILPSLFPQKGTSHPGTAPLWDNSELHPFLGEPHPLLFHN